MTSISKLTIHEHQALLWAVRNGDLLAVKAAWKPDFNPGLELDYQRYSMVHLCVINNHPHIYQWFVRKYPEAASGCLEHQEKQKLTAFETALLLTPNFASDKEKWVDLFMAHPDFKIRFESFERAMLPGVECKYAQKIVVASRKKGLNFETDFFRLAIERSRPDVLRWLSENRVLPMAYFPVQKWLTIAKEQMNANQGRSVLLNKKDNVESRRKETLQCLTALIEKNTLEENLPSSVAQPSKLGRL